MMLCCGLLGTLLLSGCSGYFFYPMKEMLRTPADVGLTYEDVVVTTRDQVRIHGWHLTTDQPKAIIFFLHGNAENISTHLGSVYWLPQQGYEVLLMDYRGYGESEGVAAYPGVFEDVDAMYQWLQQYAAEKQLPVFILGQSLGASIVSYYFAELPVDQRHYEGIVLDAVFAGHRAMTRDVLSRSIITWPFQFIAPLFMPTAYNPLDHVAAINPTPLLFLHSPQDQIVPYAQGQQVFARALPPKFWVDSAGPHIATFGFPYYRQVLLNFLADPEQDPTRGLGPAPAASNTAQPSPTDSAQTDSSSSHDQK